MSFDFITQGHIINQSIDPRGNNNPPTKKWGEGQGPEVHPGGGVTPPNPPPQRHIDNHHITLKKKN